MRGPGPNSSNILIKIETTQRQFLKQSLGTEKQIRVSAQIKNFYLDISRFISAPKPREKRKLKKIISKSFLLQNTYLAYTGCFTDSIYF